MQTKFLPNLFNNIYLMDTVNVDPGNRWFILIGKGVINGVQIPLFKSRLVVINDVYPRLFDLLFAHMDKCPWRKTSLF